MDKKINYSNEISGEFIDHQGERFYVIHNVDKLTPFFISVVSASDHWLFVSSNGGLTAGRVSPETALFPYVTVDKIHESSAHTGSKTLLRVYADGCEFEWEPFNMESDGRFHINRHLYKNQYGNKLCFEEVNHDLNLVFRYTWMTCDKYGFIRQCELQNQSDNAVKIEMIDGLQNILPAGTPRFIQTNSSNLIDAYKWSELDQDSGIAFFSLYSGITDRPEPCESLKANTVFCLGLKDHKTLISSQQLEDFRLGESVQQEENKRGIRGAYLIHENFEMAPLAQKKWQFVANVEQTQEQIVKLRQSLLQSDEVARDVALSIDKGSDTLARIIASADGFQTTAEENVSLHHYANVLFNTLRGGIFYDQYLVGTRDFSATLGHFNHAVFHRHQQMLSELPEQIAHEDLLSEIRKVNDVRLESLCYEYLPITFGRRHGDPSRPWNEFAIKLKDENGNPLLSYQGNWRDIFQNWEALVLSYPQFIENIIAKFVNASTIDGFNPYRVTKEGFDWEIEDPDDPWSYIGYWGDHQIIYLLKLLELSKKFHPDRLDELLHQSIFCYANVPYRIHSFELLLENPKNTVTYDTELADIIEKRVNDMGADGKLLLDDAGSVYQVNLLEKLLVPLLSKLSNLVIDGGIWLNTQRPEWNDANNALVGQGLSMVTLYYLRRYIQFLLDLLKIDSGSITLSREVVIWLEETSACLARARLLLNEQKLNGAQRYKVLLELGEAASRYRQTVYSQHSFKGSMPLKIDVIKKLLQDALLAVDHSIKNNQQDHGLYHAYNLLGLKQDEVKLSHLYPMLEGQVAVLSSGAIAPNQAISILEELYKSDLYRPDQHSFLLYPDRKQLGFLDKNCIPENQILLIPFLSQLLADHDKSILLQDVDGNYRFNAEIINRNELEVRLDKLKAIYSDDIDQSRLEIHALYEQVFNHKEFTGRSGGMFGFEGLGCIYWHMVSKLLLAVQENFFNALDQNAEEAICKRLGQFYYKVRKGIGFNKEPIEYGAFPTDPYSHTPKHAGARQPGMTGQVKEEILTRFGELGIRVNDGAVSFEPYLLRRREFIDHSQSFTYLDVFGKWQSLTLPISSLAFSWCQVPLVYQLKDGMESGLSITWEDGSQQNVDSLILPAEYSVELFKRSGQIRQLTLTLNNEVLFGD